MWFLKLRRLARKAGREALILFFAVRHPDTPLPLKLAAGAALAYLLSPVDLIPDVPLVGFVDDLLVLSLGLPLLVRRLPPGVLADAGARADKVLSAMGFRKASPRGGAQPRAETEVEIGEPVGKAARARGSPRTSGSARTTGSARATGARAGRSAAAGGVSDARIVSEEPRQPMNPRPRRTIWRP